MTPEAYISAQPEERQAILASIHDIIINADESIVAEVGTMMSKQMILYKDRQVFKYGLASVKDYMSLHLMPMYGSPVIYGKYIKLLDKAKFQKGCINFKTADAMPLTIAKELIADCAPVDLIVMIEKMRASRK